MAIIGFFFVLLIGLGMAIGLGVLIYLVVKRLNENEPYERRQN